MRNGSRVLFVIHPAVLVESGIDTAGHLRYRLGSSG